jgi:repressor LexA
MLTDAHRKTLSFIKTYIKTHGYAPKLYEIANGIGISSRGVVHRYVQSLIEAGYIKTEAGQHRGIRLIEKKKMRQSIPFLGKIAAGQPIEAISDHQILDLSAILTADNLYALRVKGNSMVEEGILDGDIVICESRNTASNGEVVVALVDGQDATLKRFKRNRDHTVTLIPSNRDLKAMTYSADRVEIQGIYVGLVRLQ